MNIFVKMLKDQDLEHMRKEFDIIDQDKTGILKAKEMKAALAKCNVSLKKNEINGIVKELDFNSDG